MARVPKWLYLSGGLAALAALAVPLAVAGQSMPLVVRTLVFMAAGSVMLWMRAGFDAHRQQQLEEDRAALAAMEAERQAEEARRQELVRYEAQEAAKRAVAQVNARRTVSHGGMVINVHKSRAADRVATTEDEGSSGADETRAQAVQADVGRAEMPEGQKEPQAGEPDGSFEAC